MDTKDAKLVCQNILLKMGCSKHDNATIIFDEDKRDLAQVLYEQALANGANPYMIQVPQPSEGQYASCFSEFLSKVVSSEFAILLLSPFMLRAKGIMDVIGRPDQGIKKSSPRFFCDWALPMDSFVRVYSAKPVEVECYRNSLLKEVGENALVRVITDLGTDIVLLTRNWISSGGEIFTSPVESSANGTIVFDSSMYWGKPECPIKVTIENGTIKGTKCLGGESEQYRLFLEDSKRDQGASVLAELGIGINPNADPYGHGMEAELARGTCHFDFGNNIPFGGKNHSSIHYGGTVWQPRMFVDGRLVLAGGRIMSLEEHRG
jgi:hypothetical protein